MFRFIKEDPFLLKIFRFGFVGGSAFLISFVTLYLLSKYVDFFNDATGHYGFASVIGDLLGLICGFYMNKHWTYTNEKVEGERYFFKYVFLYSTTILLNYFAVHFFVQVFHIYVMYSKIIATAITTALNFLGTNFIVFKEKED